VPDAGDGNRIPRVDGAVIVYDGECPVCSAYVRFARLRESVGQVQLVNARTPDPWVELSRRLGFDLDQGMVLFYGGRAYYGADSMHMIAMLSSGHGLLNRAWAALMRNQRLARFLYPGLRAGRNLLLRLLGKPGLPS
jgi:predicted DCC family thiol-disulfide oxidoreductase YuxK